MTSGGELTPSLRSESPSDLQQLPLSRPGRNSPFCQHGTRQFRPFCRASRGMSKRSFLSAVALLVFVDCLLVIVGPQCGCITAPQLPPFGRLLVAAPRDNLMRSVSRLEMQRRATGKASGHSSRPQHPAPYLRPRIGKPSKRSTRPPLCFQHVAPTYPTGHGLALRILRATAWCYTSSGPWLGASLPEGHGSGFFASFGPRFGISHPAVHSRSPAYRRRSLLLSMGTC